MSVLITYNYISIIYLFQIKIKNSYFNVIIKYKSTNL
jgi:hypothetical protein